MIIISMQAELSNLSKEGATSYGIHYYIRLWQMYVKITRKLIIFKYTFYDTMYIGFFSLWYP